MQTKEYTESVLRSESTVSADVYTGSVLGRLLHASMGICTEAGEFQDSLKKYIYYNKHFDKVNLIEELGDLLWYIALACDTLEVSLEDVMEININKLRARYPDKFTEDNAINRDLAVERQILEGNTDDS